jgi:diacylglycerol kinase (ATP)
VTNDRPPLVLVNVSAGSAEEDRVQEVCRALAEHSPSGTQVRRPGSDEEYAATLATAQGRDVVVVGGDGSVHRLLQGLLDQQLLDRVGSVGVVPMGTGNDLARGAAIPLDRHDAVGVAVGGRSVERGLLVDEDGHVVTNVAHCGVAAEATAHAADVKGVLGRAAYLWGAARAGLTRSGWHLRVIVDGRTVVDGSDRVLMVSVALGPSVGGGTLIAPAARADDDVVDVLVARGTSLRARIGFARDLRRARHTDRADVSVSRGREVVVEAVGARDAFRVNADGDVSEHRVRSRRWRLLDGAWRLRVQH